MAHRLLKSNKSKMDVIHMVITRRAHCFYDCIYKYIYTYVCIYIILGYDIKQLIAKDLCCYVFVWIWIHLTCKGWRLQYIYILLYIIYMIYNIYNYVMWYTAAILILFWVACTGFRQTWKTWKTQVISKYLREIKENLEREFCLRSIILILFEYYLGLAMPSPLSLNIHWICSDSM